MQKPCKGRENENACRARLQHHGSMQERRQGVKKYDTVEKRMTGEGRCKVQGARCTEKENPKSEARNTKQSRKIQIQMTKVPWTVGFRFEPWNIRIVNLFWISNFEIRIWTSKKPPKNERPRKEQVPSS
jgi:hypothetical protein